MNVFLVCVVVLLLAGGAIFVLYKFYEAPKQAEATPVFHTFNVKFLNAITKKEISTPYRVVVENSSTLERKYLGVGYDTFQVEANQSLKIINDQQADCFYTSKWEYPRVAEPNTIRVEIPVTPCGSLNVSSTGSLLFEESPTLLLNARGEVRSVAFCLTWSRNILTVIPKESMAKVAVPRRLKSKAVKCYDLQRDLIDNSTQIPLEYRQNQALENSDFIKVYLLDGDKEIGINAADPWEGNENQDIALRDIEYTIMGNK